MISGIPSECQTDRIEFSPNVLSGLVWVGVQFVCKSYQQTTPGGKGAQWLSGRVLDSRPKGSGFEPHRRHCVVVLEQDTFILA